VQPATVTGVGAWPGTDVHEVAVTIRDVCPDFPHLAELPERGPGAEMIGRTMGLISQIASDFSVSTVPTGWRLTSARGKDMLRAASFMSNDLDEIEAVYEGYEGDFKIQVVGPWTLAASVEIRSGEKLLRDLGAVSDLAQALASAVESHIADVARRLPSARIALQFDEPLLRDVLRGSVPTQSGWAAYAAVEPATVGETLKTVRSAHSGTTIVHSCADEIPFDLIRQSGFSSISYDVALVGDMATDYLGEQIEAGGFVILGIEPSTTARAVAGVRRLGGRIGYSDEDWNSHIVLSPPCDLIDMPLSQVRERMESLSEVSRALVEVYQ
jgi:hypothetical protein